MAKTGILKIDFNIKVLPKAFQKEFVQYSFITLLATTGALLIAKIDSLMVTSMIGLDANAIYSIGFAMAVVIEMPRRAISQAVMPVIAEKFSLNQTGEIDTLYKKVAVSQSLISILIFLLIWVNVDNLYSFIPNKEVYQAGKWVVLLISLGKLSDVLFSVNGEIIIFSRYYLFNITATVLMSIVVILLNLFLIPVYGIEGAALSSLVAMFFFNLVKYFYIKLRLGFDPFSPDLAKIILLGGLLFTVDYFLPNFQAEFLDLLLRSTLVLFLYGLGIYSMNIANESQLIFIRKFRSFYGKILK